MRRSRQHAPELPQRLYRDASDRPNACQKAIQDGAFDVVRRLTSQRCRMLLKAYRSSARDIAHAACQVGQHASFVKATELPINAASFSRQRC